MTTHGLSTTAEHFGMQVARELKNPEVIEGLKNLSLASKRRTASTAVMIKGRDGRRIGVRRPTFTPIDGNSRLAGQALNTNIHKQPYQVRIPQ